MLLTVVPLTLLATPATAATQTFKCAGVTIAIDVSCAKDEPAGPIIGYAKAIIRFMVSLIGIGAVMAIIVGGILYMLSQGDQAKIKKAKTIIAGAIGGVILLSLFVAIVNFLIPGNIL